MAENEEVQEKKGKGRLFAIIGVVVVAAAAGVYFFLFSGGGAPEEAVAAEPVEGVVIDGATMTVALQGEETHFARVSFALVLVEGADTAVVGNRIQLVQDGALSAIAAYDPDSLKTPEGLDDLRSDLTAVAHDIYPDGEVMRIVLTEVIVQ